MPIANPLVNGPATGTPADSLYGDGPPAGAAALSRSGVLGNVGDTPMHVAILVLLALGAIAILNLGGFKFVFTAGMGRS